MQATLLFTTQQKVTQIQMKNLLQPNEFLDFYRQNKQKNSLQFGKNLKKARLMKQNLQNQWTDLNLYYKTLQIMVGPGRNLTYHIRKFMTRKKQLKTVRL